MKTQTSRVILAVIAILLSSIILFFIVPSIQNSENEEVSVVVAKADINEGRQITEANITTKQIAKKYLPESAILDEEQVIGQYASTNITAGDFLFANKISATTSAPSEWTSELDSEHVAISFTIRNFAAGLSAKIQANDIISIIALEENAERPSIPAELTYVRVLAITANTAEEYVASKENQEEKLLPVSITVLVTPQQAVKVAELDMNGNIYVALVSRDDSARAEALLSAQEEILIQILEAEQAEQAEESQQPDQKTEQANQGD